MFAVGKGFKVCSTGFALDLEDTEREWDGCLRRF